MKQIARNGFQIPLGLIVCLLWAAAGGSVLGADKTEPIIGRSGAAKLPETDKRFFEEQARDLNYTLKMAQLAADRAQGQTAKTVAHRIISEQNAASRDLKMLALERGYNPPVDMTRDQQQVFDRLSKLSGDEFDRTFLRHVQAQQRETVNDFERALQSTRDADIRAFVQRHAPPFREHLAVMTGGPAATGRDVAQTDTDRQRTRDRERDASTRSNLARSESRFISEAARDGLLQMKLAHLAVDRSQTKTIQTIGHRIISEQNTVNQELKRLAGDKSLTLPTTLDEEQQEVYDRLARLKGEEFDRAYQRQVARHLRQSQEDFQALAESARDPELRSFAGKHAPVFKEHLSVVESGSGALGDRTLSRADEQRDADRARDRARDRGDLSMREERFVERVAQAGLLEMRLAHLAVDRSQDKSIQTIGHRVISEQNTANQELQRLAQSKNITLAKQLDENQQAIYDRLSRLSGEEFDRAYRRHLTRQHQRVVDSYEDMAEDARDPELRQFAQKHARVFRQHLDLISGGSANRDRTPVRGDE